MTHAAPDYLRYLDALVQRDPGFPGFAGTLTIAVRRRRRFYYWCARFGDTAEAGFLPRQPTDQDVALFLDEEDTQTLFIDGELPESPKLLRIAGDRKLLRRFFTRYTSRTGWVGIRLYEN